MLTEVSSYLFESLHHLLSQYEMLRRLSVLLKRFVEALFSTDREKTCDPILLYPF